MRMMTRTWLGALPISAMFLLTSGMAAAQDADLQAQVEDIQRRYEEAIAAQNWQAIADLYAEDVIYSPLQGGIIEDREGIRSFYEQSGLKTLDLRSSKAETVGENLVLDLGTFTATAAGEAGDMEIEGEYIALSEVGEDGLHLRSVTAFPARQAPGAADQQ